MRGKRAKQYRKLMHQYGLAFGFREPYQVLLDAAVIKDAANFRMRLGSMLATTLHGPIKPMITQCCIRHLYYDAAPEAEKRAWIDVAKQAERRRCGHHELERPLSAQECIASVVDPRGSGTNRHRYVVATQDADLRRALRDVAGVPLVYISRSVMILEPMAQRTEEVKEKDEMGKIRAGLKGRRGVGVETAESGGKRKREDEGAGTEAGKENEAKKKRAKGPKGPNPLSMKKSKKENTTVAKKVEDERAAIRSAAKRDPQAAEKAVDPDVAAFDEPDGIVDGQRKRRRKRKPKETAAVDTEDLSDDGDA